MRVTTRPLPVWPLALPMLLGACGLVLRPTSPTDERPYVRFFHASHVPRRAPARSCARCHQQPDTFEQVHSGGHAACRECHTVGDRPGPRCAFCHDSASPGAPPARGRRSFLFTHTAHRWLILDAATCGPCHTLARGAGAIQTTVAEEKCIECHRRERAPVSCDTCHVALTRTTLPASHGWASFLREHHEQSDPTCLRCHAQSFCTDCHSRDHSPLWKRSSHGLDAARDPSACASCHEADQCDRCHSTVRPADHLVADWTGLGHAMPARISPRSCLTCHAAADECARCHDD